jgi:hypothetical protein
MGVLTADEFEQRLARFLYERSEEARAVREIMLRRELGLTRLYNLVNDPAVDGRADADVGLVRNLHVELDHAVLAAYGWSDIAPAHGFHTFRNMQRWTVAPIVRVEILDRLLAENHRRAGSNLVDSRARPQGASSRTASYSASLSPSSSAAKNSSALAENASRSTSSTTVISSPSAHPARTSCSASSRQDRTPGLAFVTEAWSASRCA